jgi:TatD DNase family protein
VTQDLLTLNFFREEKSAMRIFESHCHLDDRSYAGDLDDVVQRARSAKIVAMLTVGTDGPSSGRAVVIADTYSDVYAAVGLHPHDAKGCDEETLSGLKALAQHAKVRAWGEIGLDFNRMYSPAKVQEHWFERQIESALEVGLPMIFHERDSRGRFKDILKAFWTNEHKGVVHCFSGNDDELDTYLDLGLNIGITGIVTMQSRGAGLRRMVQRIPAERLLVETDAPYLTPAPERNKIRRNEPAFVRSVLLKLAEVRGEALEELAAVIWSNTCRLFGVPENDR